MSTPDQSSNLAAAGALRQNRVPSNLACGASANLLSFRE